MPPADHGLASFVVRRGARALVTGGRDNYDWVGLWQALDALEPSLLIEGGATGWDEGAYRWAEYHKTRLKTVAAPWDALGMGAGQCRNRYMIEHFTPDILLAGRGGSGTEDCIRAALTCRVPVFRIPSEY